MEKEEGKTKKRKSEVEIQEEDQKEGFELDVAPGEFLTTLEEVSLIRFQNGGVIRGRRVTY